MNNNKTVDIDIFYLCVHKKCCDKVGLNRLMNKKNFYKMLGETYHIPKVLRIIILKKMTELRMLKEIGHRDIEVLPLLTDPEINVNRFYKQIGLLN